MKNKISLVVGVALLISLLSSTAVWAAPVLSNSGFETGNLCTPPPSGMVSWWPGDGNANDIQDGNSPTQTIGTPQFITAQVSQGIKFDGASGFVVPNNANLNFGANGSFTLDAWVRIDGISSVGDDALVDKRDRPGTAYLLDLIGPPFIAGRALRFSINDGSNVVIARTSLIPDNNFHLVAGVVDRNASTLSIYLDGVLQQSLSISNVGNISDSARLFIGHQSLDSPLTRLQPFNGVIDELEIINRALSASEIQAIFNAGSAGKCKTPPNQSPTASAGGPYAGDEGSAIALGGSASDPENDTLTVGWSYATGGGVDAGATCAFANASALSTTITCTDDGAYTVTLTANDGMHPPVSSSADLTVSNVAPDLTLTSPSLGDLYAINTAVNLSATFSDQGTNDTHTCAIDWDDGAGAQAGTVSEAAGSGTCTSSKSFTSAGVYNIAVTVTDDDGGSDSESVMIVVYDPSAGFVTGGGWIDSPSGAYTPEDPTDPDITGKANFGFVSKYQKGATVPTGQTEFQFHAGNLNFHSSNYQWLVVAGAKAQFKGTGTVNGVSGYGFLLTATDGQISGGEGVDKFRIKIWEIASGTVIYDNAAGASDDIDAANPLAIGGGSIVIHKDK